MVQALIEFQNINDLTCGQCPCRDGESDFCNLDYYINGNYKNVDTVYNSRPCNCPIKYISRGGTSIPYLMHKEMHIPLLECQKAYDIAVDYLRSQGKLKG